MEQQTQDKEIKEVSPWLAHISEVYKWAGNQRPYGGRLTRRTIQWYATSGLIPAAQRIGKEAYYGRSEIIAYLRSIEILNRRFGLLLSGIRKIIRKAEGFGEIELESDENGQPIFGSGIQGLHQLLEDFLEYETNEASLCDSTMAGPDYSLEQQERLNRLESEMLKRLQGSKDMAKKVVEMGLINLEEELFPKGKVEPEPVEAAPATPDGVPF